MTGRFLPSARFCASAMQRILRSFRFNASGVTTVEFAIVAPVFLLLVTGMMDLGHLVYAKSILDGAVQAAARSSSLETADTTAADAMVLTRISPVMPGVSVTSTRQSYYDFSDIGRPEIWNDANANGTCDNNESYTDENNNGQWDSDVGADGNGGADDVVLYTVQARFSLLFGGGLLPPNWGHQTLTSTAVRKNQPFANQAAEGSSAGTCA